MSDASNESSVPEKSIEQVAREVGLYDVQAYYFVGEALEWLMANLDERRHVTGAELSRAVRDLAVERFGMLAQQVLTQWGITSTDCFGQIVYAMIEAGQMSRTDQDDIDDFNSVYDFDEAFEIYRIPGGIWEGEKD